MQKRQKDKEMKWDNEGILVKAPSYCCNAEWTLRQWKPLHLFPLIIQIFSHMSPNMSPNIFQICSWSTKIIQIFSHIFSLARRYFHDHCHHHHHFIIIITFIVIITFALIIIIPLSLQCRVASLIHNQPSDQRSALHEQQYTYFYPTKIMIMIMIMMIPLMMTHWSTHFRSW